MEMAEQMTGGMPDQENSFYYRYCAPRNDEVERIRQKYMPKEASGLDRLRQMDADCTRRGGAMALAVGILGTLILGIGMCCCMVGAPEAFVPGIVIGCAGIACAAMAYPVCTIVTKKARAQAAPEILRLADELLK